MARVTVIGEVLLDMVPDGRGEGFRPVVGGGPLNTAVAARRLGCDVSLMARLSRRGLGTRVRAYVREAGLDTSGSVDVDEPVTLAFVVLDDAGRATYDFYTDGTADWGWQAADLARLPDRTTVVHSGSLAASVPPGATALLEAYRRWRERGGVLLSYDPNIRPAVAADRSAAVRRTEAYVRASHLVKVSDEDLTWLYPDRAVSASARTWSALGAELVVLTRGGDLVEAYARGGARTTVRPPATEVADTIGAGDTFSAALLTWLVDHDRAAPGRLGDIPEPDLARALTYAAVAAAITCERTGALPPTREDVAARSTGG